MMAMLERGTTNWRGIWVRIGATGSLMLAAVFGGLWFGERSVPVEEAPHETAAHAPVTQEQPEAAPTAPPLYFFLTIPAGAAKESVLEEVEMAAAAGFHHYALTVPLPWQGDMNAFLAPLDLIRQRDPQARLLLHMLVDPPASWLSAHPDDAARAEGKETGYVSLASEAWRQDVHTALEALVSAVNGTLPPGQLAGYLIGGLQDGRWYRADGFDASPANTAGFRRWLKARYATDAALQQAWADAAVTVDGAIVPERLAPTAGCRVFMILPEMARYRDYLAYTSETTADTLGMMAAAIRKAGGKGIKILASYGYTCGLTGNDSGHFALGKLFTGELDGFAGPVSYHDRGLGGAGGVSGPVDSVLLHGKEYYLIDDTRTGIVYDDVAGEITRPKNVLPEDIYNVQERNFATALTQGLGLFWADTAGDSCLHDEGMWRRFSRMAGVYVEATKLPVAEELAEPAIAVVVDEQAQFLLSCDRKLNDLTLNQVRESALRAGIRTKTYLLQDVLAGNVPPAPAYLFLNAFQLADPDRTKLHAMFQQQKAAAIWMYAPGYFNGAFSLDNISQTVRMRVKAFDQPARAGSLAKLPGRCLEKDQPIGEPLDIDPLFYIDDLQTNEIAQYAQSGKTSVAVSFFEEGWASIYCAEPALTPALLRELLGILEIPLYCKPDMQAGPGAAFYDAVYAGKNLLAIHARETGDRTIAVGTECDIQDLLAPEIGWQRRHTFTLTLKTGDTRLLRLKPCISQ